MLLTPLFHLDRASGLLAAQLLSSQTVGTFQFGSLSVPASALGTQSWNMPSGWKAVLTIESEQILVSGLSYSGGVVTATIDTRGYNGTQAATHASTTAVEIHLTKATMDAVMNHLKQFDEAGMIVPTNISTMPSITSATVHTLAGDYTSYFVAGRAYLFKVSSTWYRAVVRSATYGGGNTTINISGDGLTGSGTILSIGFEFEQSVYGGVDYELVKECTNIPAQNPPAGYNWLFTKAGGWYTKDSSGNIRFLTRVRATVSSSGGVVACDWSAADIYDITLTENITQVTHSNGVEGQVYKLRIKQHASAAKTVALNTAGGTRFSNTISGYVVTTDLSAIDVLEFLYHGTDTKYDLVAVTQGFQASPTAAASLAPGVILPYGGITAPAGYLMCDGSAVSRSTYAALFAILAPTYGTVTMTIASPCVVTLAAHGLQTGDSIYLTTTGALPTGLSQNTRYWIVKIDANTFNLATSLANALAGTKINTSGSQSGTHTMKGAQYGIGDGSTTFNVPDMRGNIAVGRNVSDTTDFGGLGQTGGEKTHVLALGEMPAHTHTISGGSGTSGSFPPATAANASGFTTSSQGSGTAHNNIQPYVTTNHIIKT